MDEMTKELLGDRLLNLRMEHNLTQEDVADSLNVSRQSVSKWELNKTLPDVDKLLQLSDMYQVSLDYLVRGAVTDSIAGEEAMAVTSEQAAAQELDAKQEPVKKNAFLGFANKVLMLGAIISACMLIYMIGFTGKLLFSHTFSAEGKTQDVICVDRILEQYTKAEFTTLDEDNNFVKKIVWLDVPGVRENDYVNNFTSADATKVYFQYYERTLLLASIVTVLLGIVFMAFLLPLCVNRK